MRFSQWYVRLATIWDWSGERLLKQDMCMTPHVNPLNTNYAYMRN